jgi:general stress protein 26
MVETTDLLRIAREIIAKVPSCMAITLDRDGKANTRVVTAKPPAEAWMVRFVTDRGSRKCREIERSGRLTLAYQHDPGNAYVTLIGHAVTNDDIASKTASWRIVDCGRFGYQ